MGKPWTTEELKQLAHLRAERYSYKEIAEIMNRTPEALKARMYLIRKKTS